MISLLALASLTFALSSTTPTAPRAETPLPPARTVDAILADVVAALGGPAALGRHRSLHTRIEITFKGLGITGTAEHYGAVGDKALTITAIPNLASSREGSDGTRFWSEDPINGLRLLEGAEAEQARVEAAWNPELRMKELFREIEVKNQRNDDGSGGYLECLTLVPELGSAMTECYDPKTHLLALQKGMRSSPQGDMPFLARLSEWKTVGDLKVAYLTDMQVGPLAFTGRILTVEVDVPVDAALFAVPRGGETPKAHGARARGPAADTSLTRKARINPAATKAAAEKGGPPAP